MTAPALLEILHVLEEAGVSVWLDGGWGVDALLERQTRQHRDVDIVIRVADVPKLQEVLSRRGFAIREGAPPNSFVLSDDSGLEVDVHAVVFDDDGNGVYRMEDGQDWIFPAEGFSGRGVIEGVRVPCLSPTTQVLCHARYEPTDKDMQDMALLQERFDVERPRVDRRSP